MVTLLIVMESIARPIDAHRHRERRMRITNSGLTVFAREGYAGATTAATCREAGISSGAFFHHVPKKVSLLSAILQQTLDEGCDFFTQRQDRTDAAGRRMVPRCLIRTWIPAGAIQPAAARRCWVSA